MTEKNYLEKWYPFHVSVQYRKIHQNARFAQKWRTLRAFEKFITLNFRATLHYLQIEYQKKIETVLDQMSLDHSKAPDPS